MTEKFWETAIRQGNHFIKLLPPHYQRDKWFLIDGPWFEILNTKINDFCIMDRYRDYRNLQPPTLDCPPPLTVDIIGEVEAYWEKRQLRLSYFKAPIVNPNKLPRKLENMVFERRDWTLVKCLTVDAWQCNNGIVPADLRCPYWDDRLPEIVELYRDNQTLTSSILHGPVHLQKENEDNAKVRIY